MSMIKCNNCGYEYNGAVLVMCPHCLSKQWASDPNFISAKHDPAQLPKAEKTFRSVVTPDFVADLPAFTNYAAQSGQW